MKFIKANWPAPDCIHAFTTTRQGWGGRRELQNPNFYTANQPENESLEQLLQLPEPPIWVKQTHSTIALPAIPENQEHIADATYTQQKNRVCAVLTADCLPILICHQDGTHIAAIHAGWRGLANGIIESTLQAMQQASSQLLVWLGPAIGPQKFEVGKDVYDAFTQRHAESAQAFTPHHEDKWLANLYSLASIRLQLQGVKHIYGGEFCTYSQDELFYSYRRDKGKTGRMASIIWISSAK